MHRVLILLFAIENSVVRVKRRSRSEQKQIVSGVYWDRVTVQQTLQGSWWLPWDHRKAEDLNTVSDHPASHQRTHTEHTLYSLYLPSLITLSLFTAGVLEVRLPSKSLFYTFWVNDVPPTSHYCRQQHSAAWIIYVVRYINIWPVTQWWFCLHMPPHIFIHNPPFLEAKNR